VAGAKSGDGGAAMRHTMGCKLGARAEIFARRSGAASITSAAKGAKLIPPPTERDAY
jgi:hypothetical protein